MRLEGELLLEENFLIAPKGDFYFRWFMDGEPVQEGESNTLQLLGIGTYSVHITLRNAPYCEWELGPKIITILGFPQQRMIGSDYLTVFPNPFTYQIQVKINSENIRPSAVTLTDAMGKALTIQVSQLNQSTVLVEVGKLARGMYWLTVLDEKGNQWMKKLIH